MGITAFSKQLIDKILSENNIESVIELGAQNIFIDTENPYADTIYPCKYTCIDLNGENNALRLNLGEPLNHPNQYDLVTDFGTSEHLGDGKHNIDWFYNGIKNKHELCKVGGIIISENPKTGNWDKHGFNYYTQDFYLQLAKANGYELISIGEHPAMGNTTDGWNIFCIMKKANDVPFMKKSEFKKLPICLT